MADEEILKRIDARLERGDELMEEVREEHRLNRAFYQEQVDLMLTVIDRNAEAFQGMMASLDLQREILLRFLDRLDDGGLPQS